MFFVFLCHFVIVHLFVSLTNFSRDNKIFSFFNVEL